MRISSPLDLVSEQCAGDAPWRNLIIEGDNFDALRYLRMTHAGRVKCIYIDPPYNTGNRDFVYNDRFVDANDSWRHSTWWEFMYQRLMLAECLPRQFCPLSSVRDLSSATVAE
jgi:adenine-specific DNA-methyltransferase